MKFIKHSPAILILISVTALIALPSIRYGYLLEDYKYLRPYGPGEIFRTFHAHWEPTLTESKGYRPLHTVHYTFFYLLIGGDPIRNHLLHIGLSLAGVLLLYLFLYRAAGEIDTAFWTALIYPCLGTAAWQVTWLVNRQHLLLVIFLLLSLIFYDRYLSAASRASRVYSFIFFLLALLLKEAAVVFPLIILAYALIVRQVKLRTQIKPFLPFFIATVIFLAVWWSVVSRMPADNLTPPPGTLQPRTFAKTYLGGILPTLIQSQGIRNPKDEFPVYDSGIVTRRDYIGLAATMAFFGIAGIILLRSGSAARKRIFLFGLAIVLIANIMVAAWYRTNRIFISSIGAAMMAGVLVSAVFQYLADAFNRRRLPIGGCALIFFIAYLAVNLTVYFEIQWALRPDGFLSTTWDSWVYEEEGYLHLMTDEQLRILANKLRRTGQTEWAVSVDRLLAERRNQKSGKSP